MTPQEYIDGLQMAVRDFDIIADESIRAVGIDFFKERYNKAFDKGETIKGNSFEGATFSVRGGQYKKDFRMWKKLYSYDRLNLSNADGNRNSFRKSMFFEGEGATLQMSDNATWKGDEYGSDVIKTMFSNGIDVLEYENKDEADKQLFLKEFVNRIFMGDLPF
ncbi:MAG: hypothetical protein IIW86_01550 [Clostridia bacterium]|nr:hypothetical protein [Clostridia bacterium]